MTDTLAVAADAIAEHLGAFSPTTLGDLGEASLLDRIDTKFLVPIVRVPMLLDACRESYRALHIAGRRVFTYHTWYYDTLDLRSYRTHVTGRFPRHKVRIRTYADEDTHVLEYKRKSGRGRTEKTRQSVVDDTEGHLALLDTPPFRYAGAPRAALRRSLHVAYRRLTLVHTAVAERITIDLDYRATPGTAAAFTLPEWAFVAPPLARPFARCACGHSA
jgi:hypothetical protein